MKVKELELEEAREAGEHKRVALLENAIVELKIRAREQRRELQLLAQVGAP
eukprot:SAG11_NODE_2099_length_3827_cov_1.669796_6_plen_51_part_00